MNFEEDKSRLERLFSRIDAEEEKGKAFHKRAKELLASFPLEYWEHNSSEREVLKLPLQKLAVKYSSKAFDCFDLVSWLFFTKEKPSKEPAIPPVKTREEAGEQLMLKLKNIHEDKEYYCQVFWEIFEEKRKRDLFFQGLHKEIKRILTDYYEEDILSFDGDVIRSLNGALYFRVVSPFIDEYFELVSPRTGILRKRKTD